MSALTDYAEKLVLDWLMTNGAATRPTAWFVGLFTAAPNDAGGGTELTIGSAGYARQAVTFSAAATPGGTTSNSAQVVFTAAGGNWGTVTHIAIFDASTAGNQLWHGALTNSRTVNDGDQLIFAATAIGLTLA